MAQGRRERTLSIVVVNDLECHVQHEQSLPSVRNEHRRPARALCERRQTRVGAWCRVETELHEAWSDVRRRQRMRREEDRRGDKVGLGRRGSEGRIERLAR